MLEQKIGYEFKNKLLLTHALTHASSGEAQNYERLEFLGDRVLGLVMADILFRRFPEEKEGDLAKRHAALVQGKTLAEIATDIELGNDMVLSDAERGSGGAENENILADGLEALLGAMFLDGGMSPCLEMITTLWGARLDTMVSPPVDAKTGLQEWAQARGLGLPVYALIERTGPDHAPTFTVQVSVEGFKPVAASAGSRRMAEKQAAEKLLAQAERSS